jgi:hypothetical protein
MTTAQKLSTFRRARRNGDISTLAERTGYSAAMVSMTLNGQRNNETIVDTAYRLVRRRKQALA